MNEVQKFMVIVYTSQIRAMSSKTPVLNDVIGYILATPIGTLNMDTNEVSAIAKQVLSNLAIVKV